MTDETINNFFHRLYLLCIAMLFVLLCTQSITAKPNLDLRNIIEHYELASNKELKQRIIAISNEDFYGWWSSHCVMYLDLLAVGDYLAFSTFPAHSAGGYSYILYNPKTDKLSVSYEDDTPSIDTTIYHVASEESQYPYKIHESVFGSLTRPGVIVVYGETFPFPKKTDAPKVSDVVSYILNCKYDKALNRYRNYSDLYDLNIDFDSIHKARFYDFREYAFKNSFNKNLLIQCAYMSEQFELYLGSVIATTYDIEDEIDSYEYAIRVYERFNTSFKYDSCIADISFKLAHYQIMYEAYLDASTRTNIKMNLDRALRIYTRHKNKKIISYIHILLGQEYCKEYDFINAEKHFIKAKLLIEDSFGQNSAEYIEILDRLRDLYYRMESYLNAKSYAKQHIQKLNEFGNLSNSFFTEITPWFYDSWDLRDHVYSSEQAEQERKLYKQCYVRDVYDNHMKMVLDYYIQEKNWEEVWTILKEENSLMSLVDIRTFNVNGVPPEYQIFYWESLLRKKKNSCEDISEFEARDLIELSKLYRCVNDTLHAYEYASRAFQVESNDSNHFYLREIYLGCAELALWAKKYSYAELFCKKVVEYYERTYGLGYQNMQKAKDLELLVNIYLQWGNVSEAVKVVSQILQLTEQPDGVRMLNYKFLGDFEEQIGNDSMAIEHYREGGLIEEIERVFIRRKDFAAAIPIIQYHFDSIAVSSRNQMLAINESDRQRFWRENCLYVTDTLPKYCYEGYDITIDYASLAYDLALFTKGFLLSTSEAIKKTIMSSGNQELIDNWRSLLRTQDALSQTIEEKSRLKLHERARYLETQILKTNDDLLKNDLNPSISWADVKKCLKSKEIAMELFTVPLSEDSTMYCALLLRDTCSYPVMIPLFEEKEVLPLATATTNGEFAPDKVYSDTINGKELTAKIWSKIMPYIKPGETVYFAPSGFLHQLAIEALPYDSTHTMADMYNMVRLSSTREIVMHKNDNHYTSATLYGGIQYDVNADTLLAESRRYAQDELLASRGIEDDTLDRGDIKYLAWTKTEVEDISDLLQKNKLKVKLYTATSANEESFKALSGKHQNILHIATHGFFWTDSTAQKKDYFTQRMMPFGNDRPAPPSIDPLNRCGLLFAGAQTAWSGHSAELQDGVQDGILTAKEISLLDLRDADLVVLSACETAKGEITSDGVFGLQRAFKQAGAQTIIMSLWPVNDASTQLLMTEFYRNWITYHQSKREAFRNAQNTVRAKYEEPYYWAGFIMLD